MPAFLLALITLVTSFFQEGKPTTLPPYTPEEVIVRGEVISEEAQNLAPESSQTEVQSEDEIQDANTVSIDTTQVASYNTKSGQEMPTPVPQVAIDNSVALEAVVNEDLEVEEQTIEEQVEVTTEPNDGLVFGQTTAQSAQNNSHRP
ncbi:MAG: hypothetical protein Q8P92_03890 [Candidatus Daviesbacteria bacterium]|nr:hypothetical protein [Candidatus Daviesbacteria bacterium]